ETADGGGRGAIRETWRALDVQPQRRIKADGPVNERKAARGIRSYQAQEPAEEEATAGLRKKTPALAGVLSDQLSRNDRRFRDLLGCFNFRSALASIWRMRSRVTENCWPTSSSVWSVFMPMPKRMRSTRSSRGVSDASTRVVVSRRFDWIAASIGRI